MVGVLFCHPFGAGYVIAFTRGFTSGYLLSALRAYCRCILQYAPTHEREKCRRRALSSCLLVPKLALAK
ncbi:MAG: hypothetical protein HW390_394 [Candidatus Brocadiaceae bacterium]|nr:hypothetical protein [Candidatus Brocadiaceae bacterium]